MIHTLTQYPSPADLYIAQMRDINVQKDPQRFRNNIKRLSHLLAFEIGKTLDYKPTEVTTPLGTAKCRELNDKVVIACIFRAALPMHEGFLDVFDYAESSFLAEYRSYNSDGGFDIKSGYVASPRLDGKILIMADPMLVTGASIVTAMDLIKNLGTPKHIHFASIISSKKGIETVENLAKPCSSDIWTIATDDTLNSHGYIVPGLGDAGDLCFGEKL
ncbi:MAG: uracil phosphoribosyltransferase [Bacteroidales bacterium]|nr:uracil phosphoribosyltransferase [Bacteroidales bacterium]